MERTRELTRAEIGASIEHEIEVFLRMLDLWAEYTAAGMGVVEACQKAQVEAEMEMSDGI